MKIELGTVRQSPFVGVFSIVSEKLVIAPKSIAKREEKMVGKLFGVEVVKASIANSSLLGVLAVANKKGMVAADLIGEKEVKEIKEAGISVKRVENITAVGNLLAVNDSKGICSRAFPEKQRKEIGKFLSIDVAYGTVGGSDLVGARVVATNKGFLASPNATEKELKELGRHFGLEGAVGTANCGDAFVGNSLVANSGAVLAGLHTTGPELSRIDDGLGGV